LVDGYQHDSKLNVPEGI